MGEYIFEHNESDEELERLRLIEAALDANSIRLLQQTGVGVGGHCLELGAGAGSIARWMGATVGPSGRVVAIDRSVSHLQDLSGPPFEVIQGDFVEDVLEGRFDLAHCRYVLIHNSRSRQMLKKLCDLVKPKGFVVVEEPDFTSAKQVDCHGHVSHQRVNDAICAMFERGSLNPAFGLSLPAMIAGEGLALVHVDSRIHLSRGGEPIALMMGKSTWALRDKYVETGKADEADIEGYLTNANDRRIWAVYYSTVSVIAVK